MKSAIWMWTRIVCSLVALAWFGLADAQSLPPRLKPIPPRGPRITLLLPLAAPSSAASPWQPLNNQPPFTPNDVQRLGFPRCR